MDERQRRQWAAAEAMALGHGGVSAASRATGMSRTTIAAGIRELKMPTRARALESERVRRPGGGRKHATVVDAGLEAALRALVESSSRGDPESPLLWTCKSTRVLARELTRQHHAVSPNTVASMLRRAGYSLQSNRKTREGASHPDRNAQFEHVAAKVLDFIARGQPAISVDTKKKELVGDFRNAGRTWRPKGEPEKVRTHDFLDEDLGKAIPYGIYDIGNNEGWVSVGISHDTAEFAVNTIRLWWKHLGRKRFPRCRELLITADCGGSNGNRSRLWRVRLQDLTDELGIRLSVCHFPPGTSKWNKIEHRLFSFITSNWRGRPLVTREAIVNLIASTKTRTGLVVKASLDKHDYSTNVVVSEEELAAVRIKRDKFHGDWNYTIEPRTTAR
jgi:hypothetical protein